MAYLEFHYPDEVSPTANWVPSIPNVLGSKRQVFRGVATDVMSDGATIYTYNLADKRLRFKLEFSVLTDTDISNLETFIAAVAGGNFRFKLPTTSGSYYWGNFAPSADAIEWTDLGGGLWSGTFEVWEAVGS